uniref:Large ribosomal subunit protein uL18m n=1 Tax=Spirometra erinaceieuropaei TaxID=99802 RepID=A0A0F6MV44_SPIER|nr:mitochondrial 39S ribosomal protein L18 [Spirometra erinaceieuropaei]
MVGLPNFPSLGRLFRSCAVCRVPNLLNHTYSNRNPRNFELMGVASKTLGWEFQAPRKDYWHKCVLNRTAHHTAAQVVHCTSRVVLSASTEEPSISKHLYSNTDTSAAENIGRILAYRCQCSGITSLLFDVVENPLTSLRNKAFYDALISGGVALEEKSFEHPQEYGIDYDSLTEEEKLSLYPRLIDELRTTPDWGMQKYPFSLRPSRKSEARKRRYQVLSEIRQGYVWDEFYHRMVKPKDMAAWQVEQGQIFAENLGKDISEKLAEANEPAEVHIPEKWRLE